jgi:hypothetical protein
MAHPTRIFNKPEELAQAFEEFKEDVKEQAKDWLDVQYVGRNGDKKETAKKVPLTIEGFKRFCRTNYGCVEQYFTNQDGFYDEFIGVCTHVKEEIRENQIIGGMLNLFNPSITQRLNSLSDKQEVKQETTIRDLTIEIVDTNIPLAGAEKDIEE